ncbi:hypothetical protein Q7P37_002300 [Cladosporium fusiforme]
MSGFESIAAAIGVAEIGLRAMSRIYEFVQEMKDAPESVIRLFEELSALKGCMSRLASLGIAGPIVPPDLQELDLSAAVNRCGAACSSLEANLRKWTHGGGASLISRLRVKINKSQIESAILSISSTKNTISLAVTIASYSLTKTMSSLADTTKADQPDQAVQANQSKSRSSLTEVKGKSKAEKKGQQIVEKNIVESSERCEIGAPYLESGLLTQSIKDNQLRNSGGTRIG